MLKEWIILEQTYNYWKITFLLQQSCLKTQGQHRQAIANFSKDKKQLEKETNIWINKYDTISSSLEETEFKLKGAKEKLSRYDVRNVNKLE